MGNKQIRRIGRFYGIAGITVMIFIAIFMVAENIVYVTSRRVYDQNIIEVESIVGISDTLLDVNEHVMLMVAGMSEEDALESINADFEKIAMLREYFLANGTHSEMELRRFSQAYYAIQAYQRKIDEVGPTLMNARFEVAHNIFTQELDPLRQCASEMISATMEIGTYDAVKKVHSNTLLHGFTQMFMILSTIGGMIVLFFAGRAQINRALEMQLKQEELDETSDMLLASRQKLMDSAVTNILTGLPNRYALEKRLSELLGFKQFYIAVLDVDNFRMVNDQYGYEYGDEYLIGIVDRLKLQFSERAEIYNIYGNEFCLLFSDEVNDMQVKTLAEQARQSMGSNTQVAGMMLSSGVSGSLYHVLPSESADVGGVLRKLDTALHQAKADGGNRLYYL